MAIFGNKWNQETRAKCTCAKRCTSGTESGLTVYTCEYAENYRNFYICGIKRYLLRHFIDLNIRMRYPQRQHTRICTISFLKKY